MKVLNTINNFDVFRTLLSEDRIYVILSATWNIHQGGPYAVP